MTTLLGCLPTSPAEVAFPGPAPGTASAEQDASGYTLSNNILTAKFILRNGSLSFGGMTSKLGPVAKAGGDLFIINLQDGRSIKSSDLKAGNVKFTALQPNPKAFRLADRFPGKAVSATFQALNGALRISWRAVLRDHSHYLRQELRLTCTKPIQMKNIIAMQYDLAEGKAGAPSVSGNARGALIVNDLAFTALETPMGINTVGGAGNTAGGETASWRADKWSTASWTGNFNVPQELKKQYGEPVALISGDYESKNGTEFTFTGGAAMLSPSVTATWNKSSGKLVIKKDGSRQSFDRSKVLRGMIRACEKRPVTVEALETAISEIETTLQSALDREVTSVRIGELIMEKLRGIDEVAYVRFASVYKEFDSASAFVDEISKLQ